MHVPRPIGAVTTCSVALAGIAVALSALPEFAPEVETSRTVSLSGTVTDWADASADLAGDGDVSAQVLLRTGATPEQIRQATTWLDDSGIETRVIRESVGVLPISASREVFARAFGTQFVQQEVAGRVAVAPATELSIPSDLTAIETVAGLVDVDAVTPTATATAAIESDECAVYWGEKLAAGWPESVDVEHRSNALCGYGPEQLRAIHDLPDDATGEGATVAVVAAYDDPSVEVNTNTYFSSVGAQPFRSGQYVHHAPDNPDETRCGGPAAWTTEQHLDVQAVHAIAPDADVVYWGADDCMTDSLYLRILDAVEADITPDVVSLSFGAPEELDTESDRTLLNRILVEAASRGVSVFASTGNDGDYSDASDHGHGVEVASPGSSPYLTSVGGTSVGLGADDEIVVEAGWEIQTRFVENGAIIPPGFIYGAGGGQSQYYARPSWQQGLAVEGTGRLMPDVASLADPNTGFTTFSPVDGTPQYDSHGGTSLATPMVAATVAVAKARTGAEIGLAAPALYALADTDALRDVQPASAATWFRRSASTGQLWLETLYMWDTKPQSLQSGPGWDPVTGLGVPSGTAFLDAFGAQR